MDNNNQDNSTLTDQSSAGITPVVIKGSQMKPGIIDPRHLVVPMNPKNGDMFYSNGTNFQKIGAGASGQSMVNKSGIPTWSNTVTGTTGSFATLNITSANASGATGATATLGPTGALDGGPTTTTQNGWVVIYVAGVKCFVPIWV